MVFQYNCELSSTEIMEFASNFNEMIILCPLESVICIPLILMVSDRQ